MVQVMSPPTAVLTEKGVPANLLPPFTSRDYRDCIGNFATGVAIVTAGEGGTKTGMTVNSLTSVSLEPPLLLFCPKNGSHTLEVIRRTGTFAVNLLTDGQGDLCGRFAGRCEGDRFAGVAHRTGPFTGAPLLDGCLARLECRIHAIHPGGDHSIVIGEVVGLDVGESASPLCFWTGKVRENDWTR
ncbi:MAG: flavin reductase family protein [Vulcanimicrobiota bacterium]